MFGRSSKKKRVPEFQAIIMAAGRGSRMMQLTSDMPKALLPVANKPMIWYPVNLLEKNGFKDVTIVVTKSSKSDIKKMLEECIQVEIQINYHCIPENVSLEDFGTVDALKMMKITHDVLILSCDLICDFFSLNKMADIHRTHDASVTVMLCPAPKVKETPVPLPKVNRVLEKEYCGVDGRHPEKVVFLSPESNMEEGITFSAAQIKRTPFIQLSPDLIDCHMYMIRKDVLKLMNNDVLKSKSKDDDKFLSLRMEFLPWLVEQSTRRPPSEKKKNIFSFNVNVDSSNKDLEMIDNKDAKGDEALHNLLDDIQCYAFVADDEIMCIRASTLVTYCEANRMIAKRQAKIDKSKPQVKSSQICPDSLMGVGLKSGEKLVIKGSVVGDHCNIGDNAKVINSVIMDHVTIGSNVTLSGCIICSNVHIENKTDMKDCLVSKGQKVQAGSHSNKEFLSMSQMMEIDD